MERAKRLELLQSLLQKANQESFLATSNSDDAAGNAPEENRGLTAEKVQVWAEELDEIVCVWPMIGESFQLGLMAIVRAQNSLSERP